MIIWDQFVYAIEWGLARTAELTGSAGIAIILFTILIKTLLLPLTIKSVRSTKAMQELQPKIRELQKKYGQDRQRLSAEMMKLYQEHGINPMSGCLPMLLQIPIFFGLYFAIRNLSMSQVGAWAHGFLWVPDLSKPDPLHILPILAGLFQFIQTRMTRPAGMRRFDDPQQQMMYSMMLFMPAMVVLFGWNFAAGPVLYWVVSALYSVVQQWLITGWGAMRDWLPFLPELPEHRRLGYVDPKKRAEQQRSGGLFGRLLQQAQLQQEGQPGTASPADGDARQPPMSVEPSTEKQPPLDPEALVPRRSRPRGKRQS
ncbi:Membrane protein insertase YidC 2 [bacterium HR27]|nr:Membrane protein insertase YidC 2 [bacterium HR27]